MYLSATDDYRISCNLKTPTPRQMATEMPGTNNLYPWLQVNLSSLVEDNHWLRGGQSVPSFALDLATRERKISDGQKTGRAPIETGVYGSVLGFDFKRTSAAGESEIATLSGIDITCNCRHLQPRVPPSYNFFRTSLCPIQVSRPHFCKIIHALRRTTERTIPALAGFALM